jgi:hypothetical protein
MLRVVERKTPSTFKLLVDRNILCTSILLVVDRDAPCTSILLISYTLHVLSTGGRQGNAIHVHTRLLLVLYCTVLAL